MSNEQKWAIGIISCLVILCLCIGSICVLGGGLAFLTARSITEESYWTPQPQSQVTRQATRRATRTPRALTPIPNEPTATQEPFETQPPASDGAYANLQTLEEVVIPINDPYDLALRLKGISGVSETLESPPPAYQPGDKKKFWAFNDDERTHFEVDATLRYASEHLYFWVQDGVKINQGDLDDLGQEFETRIYPTNREFFGSEWTPGVDNDPHLYVLYTNGVGSNVAGYYSANDEVPQQIDEYSNAHEMFVLHADNVPLGGEYAASVIAHEFQHMIHWNTDRNEDSWVNEGFSMLAEILNNYDPGNFDMVYVRDPDVQLTYWPSLPDSRPNYGMSMLFLSYFLDRFGEEATQALVAEEENSLESMDKVLQDLNITDPVSGTVPQADNVFADWVITSYLNDPNAGDGRFAYQHYQGGAKAEDTQTISDCPSDWQTAEVSQYGVDYIGIDCSGSLTLEFEGTSEVGVLPVDAASGQYAFWSNRSDSSDMTLTQQFDFSNVSGPIEMTYQMWYDIETEYDYLYLLASEDGQQWEFINTPSGTDSDPSGNNYGWGYTDKTGDWVEETVDLSKYAGKQVQLRFEYVTDMAVNENGFLLDDVSIPAINYSADFEADEGGWEAQGFVRLTNQLPQTYRVSLITQGDQTDVQYVTIDEQGRGTVTMNVNDGDRAVLVVSGTTRHTNQAASYRFRISE